MNPVLDDAIVRALADPDPDGAVEEQSAVPDVAVHHIIALGPVGRSGPDEGLADLHSSRPQVLKR